VNKRLTSSEKKLTLLLLCWLFGLFGIHRFYTGKYISGGLQLLGILLGGVAAFFEAKVWMLSPPLIPHTHTSLQNLKMFRISHCGLARARSQFFNLMLEIVAPTIG
jgi:hypothetical protein